MFPYLNEIQTSRDMIDIFYGYNANERIRENEFADMKNMSSDKYPMMSPRKSRGIYRGGLTEPSGMIVKDNVFCYVNNSQFIIRYSDDWEGKNTVILDLDLDTSPKQLVSMGSYVLVFPDKKYFNITDPKNDNGSIENVVTLVSGVRKRVVLCQEDGTEYKNEKWADKDYEYEVDVNSYMPVGVSAPSEVIDGFYWIDTTIEDSPMLKRWSETAQMWTPITTTYLKLESEGIAKGFFKGDGVEISGFNDSNIDGLKNLLEVHLADDKNTGDVDYIVVSGMVDLTYAVSDPEIIIRRTVPDMDFICESGNRLWGCKYGKVDGKFINEIYASKLGDFKNWNCFEGLSTDSYAVSCGSDGPFTGAISYGNRPTFFKEHCMHYIYGSYPAEFQTITTECRGVQQGCACSLAIVNEVLFYKSRAGIMTYDGSLPIALDNVFGDTQYDKAVACGFKNKYYISMRNCSTETYEFFVYDKSKNLWHKEDDLSLYWIGALRDNVYYVENSNKTKISCLFGDEENDVEWYAITGQLGLSYQDSKYISRIDVRVAMAYKSSLCLSINYDNDSDWKQLYKQNMGKGCGTISIPIRTRRCDHFRLKFEGKGDVKIISIGKIVEQGSSLRGGVGK